MNGDANSLQQMKNNGHRTSEVLIAFQNMSQMNSRPDSERPFVHRTTITGASAPPTNAM
jgi:hypothetical protein